MRTAKALVCQQGYQASHNGRRWPVALAAQQLRPIPFRGRFRGPLGAIVLSLQTADCNTTMCIPYSHTWISSALTLAATTPVPLSSTSIAVTNQHSTHSTDGTNAGHGSRHRYLLQGSMLVFGHVEGCQHGLGTRRLRGRR